MLRDEGMINWAFIITRSLKNKEKMVTGSEMMRVKMMNTEGR